MVAQLTDKSLALNNNYVLIAFRLFGYLERKPSLFYHFCFERQHIIELANLGRESTGFFSILFVNRHY